jgi:hypothetical protein
VIEFRLQLLPDGKRFQSIAESEGSASRQRYEGANEMGGKNERAEPESTPKKRKYAVEKLDTDIPESLMPRKLLLIMNSIFLPGRDARIPPPLHPEKPSLMSAGLQILTKS